MGQPNLLERVKEWIAGIAWDIFLWASNMTDDEYRTLILEDAAREIASARANDWMLK